MVAYTLPKLNYESEVELRVTLCGLSEKHDIRQRNRLVSPRCVACRRPGADVGGAGPILAQMLEGWVASELTAGPARCCAVHPRLPCGREPIACVMSVRGKFRHGRFTFRTLPALSSSAVTASEA